MLRMVPLPTLRAGRIQRTAVWIIAMDAGVVFVGPGASPSGEGLGVGPVLHRDAGLDEIRRPHPFPLP
jgi:hypothetical protein